VERAVIFGWSWSPMGWNILMEPESNEVKYLDGAGVQRDGISLWSLNQMSWHYWLELKSNELLFLAGAGVEKARIFA
jgi:hypothetical protein